MAALRSMVSVRATFICGFGQSAAMTAGSSALTFITKTLGPVVMLPTKVWLLSRMSTDISKRMMASFFCCGLVWQKA